MATKDSPDRSRLADLRRLVTRNPGLRALALLLAIALWVFVNAGEHGSVQQFTVPISYRSIPPGMVIVNHPPDFVKIEVNGPRTLLSLLEPERLTVKLDLKNVVSGQSEFRIEPQMFNAPRGTEVTQISPDQVTLDIDHIVSREVPVHLVLDGKLSPGYVISGVELRPPTVSVTGPSRYVAPLTQIDTDVFDIRGLIGDTERTVAVGELETPVRLSAMQIDARVDIAEEIEDREIRGDVEVRASDFKFRVDPKEASATIRGPVKRLQSIEAKGLFFVDAKGIAPGTHELPIKINVPDGMQIVKQAPATVRLRTYREKLISNGDEHPS